jgi:hypothetical protein
MDDDKYAQMFEKLKSCSPIVLSAVVLKKTKQLDRAKELLEKMEWMHDEAHSTEACYCCDNFQRNGHKEDCELKMIFDELEK